ncbi:MAG: hypothetical protein PVG41_08555 [Desulfobacteraceae bacterium]|jgi:hypothetical protein
MRLDPNPLFRRIMMLWYDSTPVCWTLFAAMVLLVLFSWAGIVVAGENAAYHGYRWVPWTLLVLSTLVGVSVLRRLVRRHLQQKMDNSP